MTTKKALVGMSFLAAIGLLGYGQWALEPRADAAPIQAPMFEVDPLWPKPLPNHWLLGSAIGIGIDSRDHVFVIHRRESFNTRTEIGAAMNPPTGECCLPAPNILEFDPDGNLVNTWGGPGEEYEWPASNHGLTVDPMDNVWIGGNGRGDSHILKFSRDGKFLAQYGKPGMERNSTSTDHFGLPAKISFTATGDEAYVADGYRNRRVAVLDAETGEIKRYWGAYGNRPDDGDLGNYDPDAPLVDQFRNPVHCAEPSNDGLVYVCDRANNRIQVFKSDGTYVTERQYAARTLGDGSTWDIAFSPDTEQTFMYLADGKNMRIYVILRETLDVLTSFGDGGRQPGQFFAVHSIATDSKGNLYTTETYEGKRVQKFVYKGMGPVTRMDQGTVWPKG